MAQLALAPLPLIFVHPPIMVIFLPIGSWGISYDIGTRETERDLPDGWNARRSATYRALIQVLNANGFNRHQYSDYRADGIPGHLVWAVMFNLRGIRPPMKLESTVLGLKMQFYQNRHILDVTNMVRIGGAGAPVLRHPTPANLVPAGMLGRFGNPIPPLNIQRPAFTRNSNNANNPYNWLIN